MVKRRARVVLDTNVLVSAIVFSGKPHRVLKLVSQKEIVGVTSSALVLELGEVLVKKFRLGREDLYLIEKRLKREFILVNPEREITVAQDRDDNRVLEAAVEGGCDFVVTGDKDLLELGRYKSVRILTPAEFLAQLPS